MGNLRILKEKDIERGSVDIEYNGAKSVQQKLKAGAHIQTYGYYDEEGIKITIFSGVLKNWATETDAKALTAIETLLAEKVKSIVDNAVNKLDEYILDDEVKELMK